MRQLLKGRSILAQGLEVVLEMGLDLGLSGETIRSPAVLRILY